MSMMPVMPMVMMSVMVMIVVVRTEPVVMVVVPPTIFLSIWSTIRRPEPKPWTWPRRFGFNVNDWIGAG